MKKKTTLYIALLSVVGILSIVYLIYKNKSEVEKPDLQNFAISNPSDIDKIFMVRKGMAPITLTKKDQAWFINETDLANDQKVNMLLHETATKLAVAGPVPKTARTNVITKMAATGTKVEFWKGQDLIKTYYVGGTTPDQLGTHMWIEGAKEPYVVNIPGFNGYLNSRYVTDPQEWLSKELFKLPNSEILSVKLDYPEHPEWGFTFTKKNDNVDITVDGINQNKPVNTSALVGYFGLFNGIYCEGFPQHIPQHKIDSLHRATPYATLTLVSQKNKTYQLKVYRKEAQDNSHSLFDKHGNRLVYDAERYYAFMNNSPRIMYIQDLVFKNILVKYPDFLTAK